MFSASMFSTGFLLGVLGKGVLLSLAAVIAYGCLSKAPAAFKHLLLLATLAALLVLPVLAVFLPALPLPLLPSPPAPVVARAATPLPAPAAAEVEMPLRLPPVVAAQGPLAAVEAPPAPVPFPLPTLWTIYGFGLLLALLSTLAGLAGVLRLRKRSAPLDHSEWLAALKDAAAELGVKKPVALLQSSDLAVPVTWQFRRHAILLPPEATSWPADRRRVVLLHELAHARRRDFLAHLIARLTVALHWPNPFAWFVLHRMTVERERACDDLVLHAGIPPSDYAEHLLDIVRGLRRRALLPLPAIAMAHSFRLEGRLNALFDKRRRRGVPSPRIAAVCVTLCGLLGAFLSTAVLHAADNKAPAVETRIGEASHEMLIRLAGITGSEVVGAENQRPSVLAGGEGDPLRLSPGEKVHFFRFDLLVDGAGCQNLRYKFRPEGASEERPAITSSREGEPDHMTVHVDFYLPPDATGGQLFVGTALGPWENLLTGRIGGSGSSDSKAGSAAYTCSESEEFYTVVVSDTITGTFDDQIQRLVCSNAAGREVIAEQSGGGLSGNLRQTEFRLPKTQLSGASFTYETSPLSWTALPSIILQLGKTEYAALAEEQTSRQDALKRLGLALKQYASEAPGAGWPPSSGPARQFRLDTAPLAKYLDEGTRQQLEQDAPVYLGHLVTNAEGVARLLAAYAELGEEVVSNSDISWSRSKNHDLGGYTPPLQRLREGVERFLITDINNPAAGALAQSSAPVAWFLPREGDKRIPVLYMDGHVGTVKDNVFPNVKITTEALRNAPAVPENLEDSGGSSWTVQRLRGNARPAHGAALAPDNAIPGAPSISVTPGMPAPGEDSGAVVDTALGAVSADKITIGGGKATFQGNVQGTGSVLRDFSASSLSIDATTGAAQLMNG